MITQDSLSCEVFLTELNQSFSEAFTEEVQNRESVSALSNDKRIHPLLEEGIVYGKCESHHKRGAAMATDQDQEIRQSQKVLRIKVSGFSIIQNGSNNTMCHVQTCKCCNKS